MHGVSLLTLRGEVALTGLRGFLDPSGCPFVAFSEGSLTKAYTVVVQVKHVTKLTQFTIIPPQAFESSLIKLTLIDLLIQELSDFAVNQILKTTL